MNPRKLLSILAVALVASGCGGDADSNETPEQRALREAVYRQACAAREVEEGAEQDLATIEASLAGIDPNDPIASISRQATMAALEFGRGIYRHAQLRATTYAYLDSAANHAATTADSARFVQRANTISIQAPEPGTVEANVIANYEERLSAILADPDHPCNWDIPF